jgi:hypothetical protein
VRFLPLMASTSVALSRRGGHDGLAEQEHVESNPLAGNSADTLVEAPEKKREVNADRPTSLLAAVRRCLLVLRPGPCPPHASSEIKPL